MNSIYELYDVEFIEAVKKNTRNLLEMGIHIDLVNVKGGIACLHRMIS